MSDAIKGASAGALQNLAAHVPNVTGLLAAQALPALVSLMTPGAHPQIRETCADAMINIANCEAGKLALGKGAVPALVALAKDMTMPKSAHATAIAVLGSLMYHQDCWPLIIKGGGIGAAVAVMRDKEATEDGSERAVGLCYILCLTGKDNIDAVRSEPGCLEALHVHASRGTGKAKQTAVQAMETLAKRGALVRGDGKDKADG